MIIWTKTSKGRNVPLDPAVKIYSVVGGVAVEVPAHVIGETFYVSHFSTCPDENKYSESRKTNAQKPLPHFSKLEESDGSTN